MDEALPYAELWMGTHPNGPNSLVGVPGVDEQEMMLKDLIEANPELLGEPVVDQFGKGSLPFLFKVLSVNAVMLLFLVVLISFSLICGLLMNNILYPT